jgi:Mg2+ and Co2+ transporter CorA
MTAPIQGNNPPTQATVIPEPTKRQVQLTAVTEWILHAGENDKITYEGGTFDLRLAQTGSVFKKSFPEYHKIILNRLKCSADTQMFLAIGEAEPLDYFHRIARQIVENPDFVTDEELEAFCSLYTTVFEDVASLLKRRENQLKDIEQQILHAGENNKITYTTNEAQTIDLSEGEAKEVFNSAFLMVYQMMLSDLTEDKEILLVASTDEMVNAFAYFHRMARHIIDNRDTLTDDAIHTFYILYFNVCEGMSMAAVE